MASPAWALCYQRASILGHRDTYNALTLSLSRTPVDIWIKLHVVNEKISNIFPTFPQTLQPLAMEEADKAITNALSFVDFLVEHNIAIMITFLTNLQLRGGLHTLDEGTAILGREVDSLISDLQAGRAEEVAGVAEELEMKTGELETLLECKKKIGAEIEGRNGEA